MGGVQDLQYFDFSDYAVFGLLLVVSALIGVYFAFWAKQKQNTTAEYLLGSKQMGIFPISMSLCASYTSGITILGIPAEMYVYGTQLWIMAFAELWTALIMAYVFIPVFYNLQITSSYEYLNRRFNPAVRTLGSALFLCKMMLYIPIVIYVPALAFAQVTGFSLELLIPATCFVCIFYTSLGGIKAVVWTDTVQMFLMLAGVIIVAVLGTYAVGGVNTVIERSRDSDRLEFFNLSLDVTIRHTFWNVLLGKSFQHLASGTINQAMVQRCLAMPSLKKAQLTILIFAIGTSFLVNISCYTGLLIYATFFDCDPVTAGVLSKADQLLPYFVMKITNHVPALPGIFVSGVFSAALSTMSTGLNSMCGVILEDFVRPIYKKPISEARASLIMKIITVILGVIFVLLAFVVDKLSGLVQASGSLSGITAGTLLGMFSLGMLFPWANSTGAIAGGASAALLVGWMSIGSQWSIHAKRLVFPVKPVTIDGCDNITMSYYASRATVPPPVLPPEPAFPLFAVSYTLYTIIGLITAITVGLVVSYFTGFNDPYEMDPELFSPFVKKIILDKKKKCAEEKDKKVADNSIKMEEVVKR